MPEVKTTALMQFEGPRAQDDFTKLSLPKLENLVKEGANPSQTINFIKDFESFTQIRREAICELSPFDCANDSHKALAQKYAESEANAIYDSSGVGVEVTSTDLRNCNITTLDDPVERFAYTAQQIMALNPEIGWIKSDQARLQKWTARHEGEHCGQIASDSDLIKDSSPHPQLRLELETKADLRAALLELRDGASSGTLNESLAFIEKQKMFRETNAQKGGEFASYATHEALNRLLNDVTPSSTHLAELTKKTIDQLIGHYYNGQP